jgi:hypothetical protein
VHWFPFVSAVDLHCCKLCNQYDSQETRLRTITLCADVTHFPLIMLNISNKLLIFLKYNVYIITEQTAVATTSKLYFGCAPFEPRPRSQLSPNFSRVSLVSSCKFRRNKLNRPHQLPIKCFPIMNLIHNHIFLILIIPSFHPSHLMNIQAYASLS